MSKAICQFCNKKFNATKKNYKTCNNICWTKFWKRERRKENKYHKENKTSTVSWKIEFKNGIEIVIPQKLVKRQRKYGTCVEMHPDGEFKCWSLTNVLGLSFEMYDGSKIFVEGNRKTLKASTFIERDLTSKRRNKK